MGLESATYINQLNSAWPLSTDKRREGDDHLRLIKQAVKNTFPSINAAVNSTPLMLNQLPVAGFTAFLTELLKHVVPTGTIILWSGSVGSIPVGWALCNGSGGTPDLRDKFILGAGGAVSPGGTGGSSTTGNSTVFNTGGTVLTEAQIPSHAHGGVPFAGADTDRGIGNASSFSLDSSGSTSPAGGGQAHDHTVGAHTHPQNLPPYYALAYIMKTSTFTMPALP